ncbi:hypothetical protein E0W60_29485 (plasmid) [Cupriavidus oxalaticus]|uniref:Uncharacterized protein n=1 Tax=Cupriavidus oxalaticus TaxID=96344 RepID=A0A4P7LKE8_9BURK|nr:hypothetical protein E0W60_29485 [Cupriavidus oxalaticus]
MPHWPLSSGPAVSPRFGALSCSRDQAVANALNTRPRKTLGWKTPAEALDEYLKSVQQSSVARTA